MRLVAILFVALLASSLSLCQCKSSLFKWLKGKKKQSPSPPSPPTPPDALEWKEPRRAVPPSSQSLWSVKVFIHVYAYHHYAEILRQQLLYLHYSGLYERCDVIHVFIGGPDDREIDRAATLPPYYGDKFVVHTKYKDTSEERLTLEGMFDLINATDKVFYMHTKGVRYDGYHKPVNQWRGYMEYFNMRHWRLCLCLLDKYDTVGVGYTPQLREYAGNFWWVTGQYYLTLPRKIPLWPGEYRGHDAPEDFLLNNTYVKVFNLADHSGIYYSEAKMPPHLFDTLWTKDQKYLDAIGECFHEATCH